MSEQIPSESALPSALTTRDQWLCWRAEDRDGKMTKVPVDPTSGTFASTTDADTWSDFSTARDRAREADGLGFVFTDSDPIVGVDLDDCRIPETGTTREWATDIIDRLDSFTEISPSGTGYHVLVEGSLPDGRNRKGDIELYETARFFTVTGDHVDRTPPTVEPRGEALGAVHREYLSEKPSDTGTQTETESDESDRETPTVGSLSDNELIQRAKRAANGEKFDRLWRGSTRGYDSHSEADMALCSLLAFWTGGDATQLDRLFRDSGLMRDKWEERHFADGSTYGEKTVERAIAGTDEFYDPPQSDATSAASSERSPRTPDIDENVGNERESERLERIEDLETELRAALDQIDTLEAELAAERDKRRELASELEAERQNEAAWGSWLPWR